MRYDRVREKEIRGGCRTDTRNHRHNLLGHFVLPDREFSIFILYREPTSSDFMFRSAQNITSHTVEYAARADTRIIGCQPCDGAVTCRGRHYLTKQSFASPKSVYKISGSTGLT